MIVLALDLASRTGWAVGAPCRPPAFGSFKLDHPRDGGRFMMLARRVNEMIVEHGATEVMLEAVHVGGGTKIALPLFGYRAAAMMAAESKGLPSPGFVAPATWRKAVFGHGRLNRTQAKAAALEKTRWLGLDPKNDDEADALCLWHYRCTMISAQHLAMSFRRGCFGALGEGEKGHARTDNAPLETKGSAARRP